MTIADLFELQAGRAPAATAVVFDGSQFSYGRLNSWADGLANELRSRGVGDGIPVVLCVRRSIEMLVGMLGILKAGGAYVPIEPDIPPQRLGYLVSDSKADVILTTKELAGEANFGPAASILPIHSAEKYNAYVAPSLRNARGTDPLTCILYTSGSTGKPKGVMLHNGSILNRIRWMWDAYPFGNDECCAWRTSIGFVDHIWEIFGPLLYGIPSVLFRKEDVIDVGSFIKMIQLHRITRLLLVPSLLKTMLGKISMDRMDLAHLKYWTCSGERLSADLTEEFCSLFPAPAHTLLNIYGSTEVTADATCQEVSPGVTSIGRPIDNVTIYIVEGSGGLCPMGECGEIYVGGACVAKGYWNNPGLTAERFIDDPFGGDGRVYRTGDLGRRLSDGTIEFVGRIDQQVKIRGFRVEPGEIEQVAAASGRVRECVVVAREIAGSSQLVGYAVARGPWDREGLQDYLRSRLPEHMLPARWVEIAALPLTPNGKVDRHALPEPRAADDDEHYVAPRTQHQQHLAGIWQALLGVERIGIHDNFFEHGGHSLLVSHVVSAIHKRLGVEVQPGDLFEYPTIAELATRTAPSAADFHEKEDCHLLHLNRRKDGIPLFVIPGSGGMSIAYKMIGNVLRDTCPVVGLDMVGTKKGELPLRSIPDIAAHNIQWIRQVQPEGPYRLMGHSFGGNVVYEMARQLERHKEELDFIAILDNQPEDLTGLPANLEKADFVLQLVKDYFENFNIPGPEYPREWEMELRARMSMMDMDEMVPFVTRYMTGKMPQKARAIEYFSRLIHVRMFNDSMSYVHSGRISCEILAFKAAARDYIQDETLTWASYSGKIQTFFVPGTHKDMVTGDNVIVLARHLKQRLRHY